MLPYVVVVISPGVDDSPRVIERGEPVLVKAFVADRPLKLSMKQFCTGLPGGMKCSLTPSSSAQISIARLMNSGPLSHTITSG
jgi:hypothetical protein